MALILLIATNDSVQFFDRLLQINIIIIKVIFYGVQIELSSSMNQSINRYLEFSVRSRLIITSA